MRRWYLACSILLHVLLTAALLLGGKVTNKTELEKIDIQLISLPTAVLELSPKTQSANGTKFKRSGKKVISLFPDFKDVIARNVAESNLSDFAKPSREDEIAANLPGVLTQYRGMNMGRIRFIKSLWSEIDRSIVESPYLSEYGHVGRVVLTFELNTKGQILESTLHAQAENQILKVVAARAVRKALKNENQELEPPTENVKVRAQFLWADYKECELHRGIHQSTLSFCKYGEDKRKKFTGSEKAATYLSSLQYGFGALEEIEKYNREESRRKVQFDPFEEFRRDPDFNI